MFTTVAAAVAMETAFRGISSQPGQLISRNRAESTLSPVIRFWEMGCGVVAPHCKAAATIFAGFRVYRRAADTAKCSWWRGTVVERRSLAGVLSLSCA